MKNLMKAAELLIIVYLLFLSSNVSSVPLCGNISDAELSQCKHGTVRNRCGKTVCAKGLGEACMVYRWERDLCGIGTFCGCGFCQGCNTSLQCWEC